MVKLLPKWVMKRFLLLHDKVKNKKFDFEEAASILKKEIGDDKPIVSLILSDLRKAGWLEIGINQQDARKREYSLKAPETVFREFLKEETKLVKTK